MLRTLRSAVAVALITTLASGQNGTCTLHSFFNGPMHLAALEVSGPPDSFFDVFYALDLSGTGLSHLTGGILDASGHWSMTFVLQGQIQIPTVWIAAVIDPPAAPPFIAGPIAAAAAAAVAVPCVSSGAMSWNPALCQVVVSAKVCPGDVVEIVINGVTVLASGPAGANGQVLLAVGSLCALPAGSTISATRNGAAFLGPITT
jgi:hypothetical protein